MSEVINIIICSIGFVHGTCMLNRICRKRLSLFKMTTYYALAYVLITWMFGYSIIYSLVSTEVSRHVLISNLGILIFLFTHDWKRHIKFFDETAK